jgi:hypothetical protein
MAEAKKVAPAGDTPRRVSDVVNHNANLTNWGFLQPRTVTQLASESHDPDGAKMFFCTNETGGAVPVFSDGSNWRRVTDRAIAS